MTRNPLGAVLALVLFSTAPGAATPLEVPDLGAPTVLTVRDALGRVVQDPTVVRPGTVEVEGVTVELRALGPRGEVARELVLPAWGRVEPSAFVPCDDPVEFRFAFYGCNRLGFGELTPENPSSANRAQLLADFRELPRVSPPVRHLLFTGDLVTNLDPGSTTLARQLDGWIALYRGSDLASSPVQLVPFTGNHEVLLSRKDPATGKFVEYPNPETLPVWVERMGAWIRGHDGPTTAGANPDGLTADQSRLSYTFRDGGVLFVVLNTDTFVDDVTLGDVPLRWLEGQLGAAQADPAVEHVFVLGHKPLVTPPDADEPIRPEEAPEMERLLATTPKVRGYLCAHAHTWEHRILPSGLPQVIAGNGGSPVDPSFRPDGWFGYTLVSLHRSGLVSVESWGRPIPDPYNAPGPVPPAALRVKRLLGGR